MSRGRRTLSLEDLQGVARDGFATSVVAALLGPEVAAQVTVGTSYRDVTAEALSAPNVDWEWYAKPADWHYRTDLGDLRVTILDRARYRLPEALGWLAACVVHYREPGEDDPAWTVEELATVTKVVERVRREVLATDAPTENGRINRPRRLHPRDRHVGPSSMVVTYRPDGTYLVNGYRVDYLIPEDLDPFES